MRDPYSAYAGIYDRTGQSRFGASLARLTLEWLSNQGVTPSTVLDLASGTGAAALEFARRGLRVTGLDRSAAMLTKAAENARRECLNLEFDQADVRTFRVDAPVELITSFFDSLNYLLSEEELTETMQSVHRALTPGGWFVFDLNTLGRYHQAWNDSTEIAYQDDDTLVIFRSSFDARTGISPLLLTAFEQVDPDNNLWRRWDETHVERGYPLADIERVIREAGLHPVAVEQLNERTMVFEGPATERSARAVFFTQKPVSHPE